MPDRILTDQHGATIPATDEQTATIRRLLRALEERAPDLETLDNYYRGFQPLRFASEKYREAFGGAFQRGRWSDNFMALVVDALEERLNIEGFRVGAPPPPENEEGTPAGGRLLQRVARTASRVLGLGRGGDAEELDTRRADADARRIWQANQLDAESSIAHIEALVKGIAYVLVWPSDGPNGRPGIPRVTVEDALEVIHENEPGDRRTVALAAKTWRGPDEHQYLTLYYPDRVEKYATATKVSAGTGLSSRQWVRRASQLPPAPGEEPELEPWPLAHEMGRVPIVPLINRPRLNGTGRSEIADVLHAQDAINKLAADLLVAAEFAAFRQRWATGIEIPEDDEGEPIEPFQAAVNRVWMAEGKDAKFGDFSVTDLAPYVSAIEMFIQHIASRTRTPAHYLLGQSGRFPSGESLKATETGLVAKARRQARHLGEAWEDVIRLAFAAIDPNDARATEPESETIWSNPESRSEAEHTDAVIKLKALNLPDEFLWELYGLTQNQIARLIAMRTREADAVGDAFERALARTPPPGEPATVDPTAPDSGAPPQAERPAA